MNAMNVAAAIEQMGLDELRRIVLNAELRDLKRTVEANIDRGVIGGAGDEEALLDRLARCRTVEEVQSLLRMARRWEYATEPKPAWVSWEAMYDATRN